MAETIVSITRSESRIAERPLPPDDPKVRRPDISLAREVLDGWAPGVAVAVGLERTRDYFARLLSEGRSGDS